MLLAWIGLARLRSRRARADLRAGTGSRGALDAHRRSPGRSSGRRSASRSRSWCCAIEDGAGGERVPGRLPDREVAVARQPVRLRGAVHVLRRARRPAPAGARLRDRGRDRAAHDLHPRRARRCSTRSTPRPTCSARCWLATAWRIARHGGEEMRPGPQPRDADAAALPAAVGPATTAIGWSRRRTGSRVGDAAAGGAPDGRRVRRDVRDRLDPGDPRDHAPTRYIVFAANAFSLLGMVSLYFVLEGLLSRFRYLHLGLAAILGLRRREAAAGRRLAPADRPVARGDRRLARGRRDRVVDRRAPRARAGAAQYDRGSPSECSAT